VCVLQAAGSMHSMALYCCFFFFEQETLFTLLQSTQLLKWAPGGLVPTGKAVHISEYLEKLGKLMSKLLSMPADG